MTYSEHLLRKASSHWDKHEPLPIDLFYEMLGQGLDVETLERQHKEDQHNG